MCGGNNSQLHDPCGCVDVWKLPMLASFLWLCQCLKLFILCGYVDMGKN